MIRISAYESSVSTYLEKCYHYCVLISGFITHLTGPIWNFKLKKVVFGSNITVITLCILIHSLLTVPLPTPQASSHSGFLSFTIILLSKSLLQKDLHLDFQSNNQIEMEHISQTMYTKTKGKALRGEKYQNFKDMHMKDMCFAHIKSIQLLHMGWITTHA